MEVSDLCFPLLLNASCRRPVRPQVETVLIYVLLSGVSLMTVLLNLLVVVSISHFRRLHTPTNLLLLSLAVSDLLVGLLMFFQMMVIDGCWFLGDFMCTLYQCLAYVVTSASLGTMVVISVDRYVAICYPLHYSTQITRLRVQVCVCLCWICSILFQCLNLMESLALSGRFNTCVGECVFVINQAAALADLVFSFVAPITVIVVLYLRVFVVALSQARAVRRQLRPTGPRGGTRVAAKKSEMKAARALGTVILVFLICMCPYYCVSLSGQENALHSSVAAMVVFLFYFNSCLNPAIYAWFYPWFRRAARLILTLQVLETNSCNTSFM